MNEGVWGFMDKCLGLFFTTLTRVFFLFEWRRSDIGF
jgi:hypothetical protein